MGLVILLYFTARLQTPTADDFEPLAVDILKLKGFIDISAQSINFKQSLPSTEILVSESKSL